jgi:hypothetical protein
VGDGAKRTLIFSIFFNLISSGKVTNYQRICKIRIFITGNADNLRITGSKLPLAINNCRLLIANGSLQEPTQEFPSDFCRFFEKKLFILFKLKKTLIVLLFIKKKFVLLQLVNINCLKKNMDGKNNTRCLTLSLNAPQIEASKILIFGVHAAVKIIFAIVEIFSAMAKVISTVVKIIFAMMEKFSIVVKIIFTMAKDIFTTVGGIFTTVKDIFTPVKNIFTTVGDIFTPVKIIFTTEKNIFTPVKIIFTTEKNIFTHVKNIFTTEKNIFTPVKIIFTMIKVPHTAANAFYTKQII